MASQKLSLNLDSLLVSKWVVFRGPSVSALTSVTSLWLTQTTTQHCRLMQFGTTSNPPSPSHITTQLHSVVWNIGDMSFLIVVKIPCLWRQDIHIGYMTRCEWLASIVHSKLEGYSDYIKPTVYWHSNADYVLTKGSIQSVLWKFSGGAWITFKGNVLR